MYKPKFKLIYDKKGQAYSDFMINNTIEELIESYNELYNNMIEFENDFIVTTSTENILTCIRLFIAEGKLNNESVAIVYENKEYHLDKYGAYKEVFKLENFQQRLLEKILQANFKMEESS